MVSKIPKFKNYFNDQEIKIEIYPILLIFRLFFDKSPLPRQWDS